MMLTSQFLSRFVSSALLFATLGYYFSRLHRGYDGRFPTQQIATGLWFLVVAHVWIWVWPIASFRSIHSTADARRRAAVRAIPIAFTFAPTLLYPGTMFALPLPASLAVFLFVAAGLFEPHSTISQSWTLVLIPLLLSIASLVAIWFVSTCIILRVQRPRTLY